MRVNSFLCVLTFVLVSIFLIQGVTSSTCSAIDFKKSNEGVLWNYVDLHMFGYEEHEEIPPVPPYGPAKLIGGELCTKVPHTDNTERVQVPLYYKPFPWSPIPKDYALFASYIMRVKGDMNIDGEAFISIWLEVNATNINPWDTARSEFKFDIVDHNDEVRGSVEVEVVNYTDIFQKIDTSFEIKDYEMEADDYFTLQLWYRGIGELYILYGSENFPSHISIPTNSIRISSEIYHDKGDGMISVTSSFNDSCGIADIRDIQLRILALWESEPVYSETINRSLLENSSLAGDSMLFYEWITWTYLDDLNTGGIPDGNYTIEIIVSDNSSNIWKETNEVNLFVFRKVTTVIFIVIGGTSILGAFGWLYRDIIKVGAIPLFFGLPLISRTLNTDRSNQEVILKVINDNPGIWYEEVKRQSGVTNGTAVYHLRQLEKEGKIVSFRDKNKRRYFQKGKSGTGEWDLIDNTQQAILSYVRSSGTTGITPKEISKLVGLSRRRVRDYLTNLVANNYIEYRPDPRDRRIILYYARGSKPSELTPQIRESIHDILNLVQSADFKTISERIKELHNVTISENQIDEFLKTNYPSKWYRIKNRYSVEYHG